jgi:hypothetical protein
LACSKFKLHIISNNYTMKITQNGVIGPTKLKIKSKVMTKIKEIK